MCETLHGSELVTALFAGSMQHMIAELGELHPRTIMLIAQQVHLVSIEAT